MKAHYYNAVITWTGNNGQGTSSYKAYSRNHTVTIGDKHPIEGSSDPSFLGDPHRYNPEDLFLSGTASCHMLWYLHLCAVSGLSVLTYQDRAEGTMIENPNGSGHFTEVILRP